MIPLGKLAPLIGLAIVLSAFVVMQYELANRLTEEELYKGGKGYVTDEVWYVDAARNILVKIFNGKPRQPWESVVGATVFYESFPEVRALELEAKRYGLRINATYTKAKAVYVVGENMTSIREFANATGGVEVIPGWMYGDAGGINEFLNLEHPPLAKYTIALVMAFLGDLPAYWRIPSVAFGAILVVMAYLLARKLVNEYLALGVAALVSVDPLVKSMSSVAMLDVYAAALSMVALYDALRGRHARAIVWLAIASTTKMSALSVAIPMLALFLQSAVAKGRKNFWELLLLSTIYAFATMSTVLAAQVIASVPLIEHVGLSSWLDQSVFGAIKWHLSIKCKGAECPPSSAPWEWFLGANSFTLYYFSDGTGLVARGLIPFYMLALAFMLIMFPLALCYEPFNRAWVMLTGVFISYVLIWILGGKTQYSFYAVQLTPLVYLLLATLLQASTSRRLLQKAMMNWVKAGNLVWGLALKLLNPESPEVAPNGSLEE